MKTLVSNQFRLIVAFLLFAVCTQLKAESYIFWPRLAGPTTDVSFSTHFQDYAIGFTGIMGTKQAVDQVAIVDEALNVDVVQPIVGNIGMQPPGENLPDRMATRKLAYVRGATSWAAPWMETGKAGIHEWWVYNYFRTGNDWLDQFLGTIGEVGGPSGRVTNACTVEQIGSLIHFDAWREQHSSRVSKNAGLQWPGVDRCWLNLIGAEEEWISIYHHADIVSVIAAAQTRTVEMPHMSVAIVDGQIVKQNLSPLAGVGAGQSYLDWDPEDMNPSIQAVFTTVRYSQSETETSNQWPFPRNARTVVWYGSQADDLNQQGAGASRDSLGDWLDQNGYTLTPQASGAVGEIVTYQVQEASPPLPTLSGDMPAFVFQVAAQIGGVLQTQNIYLKP